MIAARGAARDCLLIDLDGTLVDSAPDIADAANRRLASLGREPLPVERIKAMVGDGFAALMQRALHATGGGISEERMADLVAQGLTDYFEHVTDKTRPYPGAREVLTKLKAEGWRLALCTNKPLAPSRRILENLGMRELIETIGAGDSYPHKKPHPNHVRDLLTELGAAPEQAIMLGDHRNDAEAARAAGLPVILCTFGYSAEPVESLGPDALIDSFEALPSALAALR